MNRIQIFLIPAHCSIRLCCLALGHGASYIQSIKVSSGGRTLQNSFTFFFKEINKGFDKDEILNLHFQVELYPLNVNYNAEPCK